MLAADGQDNALVAVAAQALQIAQRRAGYDEAAVIAVALDRFAPQRQPVAVDGDHGQDVIFDLEERAHVDRAALVRAHGEGALVDHLFEQILRQRHAVFRLDSRQIRIIVRAQADEVECRLAAFDGHSAVFRLDGDDAVRHAAQHLAEQARTDEHAAGLGNVGVDGGINGFLQVVAGDAHARAGLNEQTFERGDRAFGGCGAGCGCGSLLQNVFVTGKFHGRPP